MAATHFSHLQREILGLTRLGFPEVQTWPCIVPVKNDKHSFRCTLCNKVIDCGKQGIGDVKRHIQRDEHKKNAKGSRNKTTLFQACAQAQNDEDKVCT